MLGEKTANFGMSQGRQLARHKRTDKQVALLRCESHGTPCLTRILAKHASCTAVHPVSALLLSQKQAYSFSVASSTFKEEEGSEFVCY